MHILILGCGFTGIRVARRFLSKGAQVTVTTRDPARLASLGAHAITLSQLPANLEKGMLVLHSIPPDGSAGIPALLQDAPARVVYLSTTAVYGSAHRVDEQTPVDVLDDRARPRLADEAHVANGPWSSLILRPAGIYGPGRGAHESVRRGVYRAGDNYVSRIHVDDLAAHAEAGLLSTLCGAYPVADEQPSTTREVGEFCAALLGIPLTANDPGILQRPISNRQVDGSAIRRLLGIRLAYPSYREGIRAALAPS